MNIVLFRPRESFKAESLVVAAAFAFSWMGFGEYVAGAILAAYVVALCFGERREFLFLVFRDRPFIVLLALFTLNNLISSLLSVKKLDSTVLSLLWFLIIIIPVSYVRFSLNRRNEFLTRFIIPMGIALAVIIASYQTALFIQNLIVRGITIKRYSFITLGKATTSDVLVMLGGLGYGWLRQKIGAKYRWLGFLYLLFCFFGVFLSYDRGGVLSFFAVMLLVLSFDVKRLAVLLAVIGLVIFLSFHVEELHKIQHLFNYLYSEKSQQRLMTHTQLATFRAAWGMIRDHWLTGVGTGNFSLFAKQYGPGKWYAYAHNFVLQFWAENGLFGMVFGISILGLLFRRWLRAVRTCRQRYIALGAGASFIGLLVGNITNSTLWILKIALPFWLIAGVINSMYMIGREGGEFRGESSG